MSEIVEERIRETSLRDLYYVLFRHKWKMIPFFVAVIVTVALVTFLCAEIYRSEAMLLVRLGRESVSLDPTATTGKTIQIHLPRENEINSELEILKSRELLEKVVDSIGPEAFLKRPDERLPVDSMASETFRKTRQELRAAVKKPRNILERLDIVNSLSDHDKAVFKVMKNLEIEAQKDSSTISISYEAQSPKLAQDVVAKLIEFYLEKHIAVYQTPGSYRFFTQQTGHLRDSLTQSENELWKLKNETGIASVEKQREILLDHIGALEQEIEGTEAALASSRAKVEELQKTLQPTLLAERAILSSLKAKVETQKKQLVDARAELRTLNKSEVRLTQLTREISIQETNYRKYSENLEQARIDHAMEADKISNISVVQAATLPIKAVRPRKLLNLALGLFLGIFGAVGLAFFSEYLDHSIKTPEEAKERLQLPTLSSIPRVRANRISPTSKRRQDKTGDRIWDIPARIRQYYEVLGEQLLLSSNGSTEKLRVFAVVSCHRGEGVSTVATNLSTWLAQRGKEDVLLVDANTAHPSVHRIFKTKLSPGLVDVLENGQSNGDAILDSPVQKLHILSAGNAKVNLSQIFDSDRFTKQLDSMKKPYHFVVIDLPAVSQTSIVPRLASLCDGVILVVEAERLRWEVAQRTKEQLVKSNANVLGVVLNKRRFHIPGWLYRTL